VSIVFDRRGSGPPLVLVHGHGLRWQDWMPVLPALAEHHEVIALDLPGFGASPRDETDPSAPGYAARVEFFFEELGLERPAVAGFSMGGGIALELARRGSVSSAVALCPIGFWTPRERAWCQASVRRVRASSRITPRPLLEAVVRSRVGRTAALIQVYAKPWRLDPDAVMEAIDAQANAASFDAAADAFGRYTFHDAEELRGVPLTVAWGDRDYLLLSRQAARARRVLPWARHVTLHGCGHVPFADDPEVVAGVILAGADAPAGGGN
jgi:pimeloyl-ACP methyl ester carboxylesterase